MRKRGINDPLSSFMNITTSHVSDGEREKRLRYDHRRLVIYNQVQPASGSLQKEEKGKGGNKRSDGRMRIEER